VPPSNAGITSPDFWSNGVGDPSMTGMLRKPTRFQWDDLAASA
jgi:hypothetical protein